MLYAGLWSALALLAGTFAGAVLPSFLTPVSPIALWCAALCAFAVRRDCASTVCLLAGLAALGAVEGARARDGAIESGLGRLFRAHVSMEGDQLQATVEGRLRSDAVRSPNGLTLSLAVDRVEIDGRWNETSGGALISVGGALGTSRSREWRAGRVLRFPAALRRPSRYLNAGVPDGERQYTLRGTALVGFLKSDRLVDVVSRGGFAEEMASGLRAVIREAVERNVAPWSERSAAVVLAILIGDRAGLRDADERSLQQAGTYHVIAISGGNIAMLAGVLVLMLRVIRAGPVTSATALIVMLTGYAGIVGGGASVDRATLMACVYVATRLGDLRPLTLNVMAIAVLLQVFADPLAVMDAGFALTFGATLGIVVGMSRCMPAVGRRWLRPAAFLLAASIFAEAALFPIGAVMFSRITAAGLVVNFAAIPLMAAVQAAGFATVLLALSGSPVAIYAGGIVHLSVEGLMGSARLVELVPWITRRVPPPSLIIVVSYYAGLVVLIAPGGGLRRGLAVACLAICVIWIVESPAGGGQGTRWLRVTFFDVGQGDAALVQFPNGRTLLVDTGGLAGGGFDLGARVLAPALWASGVRRLDYLAISHGDADHIGGVLSVLEDFGAREIWEGITVEPHEPVRAIATAAHAAAIPWRIVRPGGSLRLGPVEVFVQHPREPDWARQRVRNDDSMVLEIRYGAISIVFTGDIGEEVERTLTFDPAGLRVVKVPHHGSASSSSAPFVSAARPDVAVISCGRGNIFGHPSPGVLSRYQSAGSAIFRTDRDGQVRIETDGRTLRVNTFSGRLLVLRAARSRSPSRSAIPLPSLRAGRPGAAGLVRRTGAPGPETGG